MKAQIPASIDFLLACVRTSSLTPFPILLRVLDACVFYDLRDEYLTLTFPTSFVVVFMLLLRSCITFYEQGTIHYFLHRFGLGDCSMRLLPTHF